MPLVPVGAPEAPVARLGDRALFPALEARAYLAHAAISPLSVLAEREVSELIGDYARLGARAYPEWARRRELLRSDLARLLGVEPSSIALTGGTTRGLTDVALAIPWRAGERILCFRGEFPANVTPWQQAARRFGLELVWLEADLFRTDPRSAWSTFDAALAGGLRLVAVSAVQFQTGFRMPLEALGARCRAAGASLVVDAVQACGVLPTEVPSWQADFVVGGAHKWLMGLEGAGFLYVAPSVAGTLVPATAGWLSHEHGVDFLFEGAGHLRYDRPLKRGAPAFEGGTMPAAVLAALGASVRLLLGLDIRAIAAHVHAYLEELELGLVQRGFTSLRSHDPAGRSGTLAVTPPVGHDPLLLQRALAVQGIITSVPDGLLRFAPHWPNSRAEIPEVLAAIDAVLPRVASASPGEGPSR